MVAYTPQSGSYLLLCFRMEPGKVNPKMNIDFTNVLWQWDNAQYPRDEDFRSKHHKDLPKSVESVGATASSNLLEVDFYDKFRDHLELQQTVLQCLS